MSTDVAVKLPRKPRCVSMGANFRKSKIPRRPLLKAMPLNYSLNIDEDEETLSQNTSEDDNDGITKSQY